MVVALADGVWWLDLGGENAFLVDDRGELTLVDAGLPWHAARITDGIEALGYGPGDVERVLVTHFDLDHVGGLSKLTGLDAPVYVGARDAPYVTSGRRPTWRTNKGLTQLITEPLRDPPAAPVRPVEDGDRIGSFSAYHTPGHTAGHVAYVSEALSVGMLGDLVRESEGRLVSSSWFVSEDTDAVRESVRDLAARAPYFDVAGMGHGVPFGEGGKDRLDDLAGRL